MITSHLDLRLRQNYDYISRSRWERPAVLALRACLRRRRKEVIRLLHRRLAPPGLSGRGVAPARSEEHTSELQSLMLISYAVFCLTKKRHKSNPYQPSHHNIS